MKVSRNLTLAVGIASCALALSACKPIDKNAAEGGKDAKDAKTALQEWLQGRRMALPQYDVVQVLGAAHRQTFEVSCTVAALGLTQLGQGASRRAAEQAAAAAMLQSLQPTSTA